MKLRFINEEDAMGRDTSHWVASTERGSFEAEGPDPLTAVTRLNLLLEIEAGEDVEGNYRY